jgi:hypothetical protein
MGPLHLLTTLHADTEPANLYSNNNRCALNFVRCLIYHCDEDDAKRLKWPLHARRGRKIWQVRILMSMAAALIAAQYFFFFKQATAQKRNLKIK